jgi:hypothetical protein
MTNARREEKGRKEIREAMRPLLEDKATLITILRLPCSVTAANTPAARDLDGLHYRATVFDRPDEE